MRRKTMNLTMTCEMLNETKKKTVKKTTVKRTMKRRKTNVAYVSAFYQFSVYSPSLPLFYDLLSQYLCLLCFSDFCSCLLSLKLPLSWTYLYLDSTGDAFFCHEIGFSSFLCYHLLWFFQVLFLNYLLSSYPFSSRLFGWRFSLLI
jgi:hypothetical protein